MNARLNVKSRMNIALLALGMTMASYLPASAQLSPQDIAMDPPTGQHLIMTRSSNDCVLDDGKTLEAFVNGSPFILGDDGLPKNEGGVRVSVHNSQADGYKWGTTVKVEQIVPGKEYWIAAMSEEEFPHLLTTVLELRNCSPSVDDLGRVVNPQAVWERAPYTHEVSSPSDLDALTLYFKGAMNAPPEGVTLNNLQRDTMENVPASEVRVRREVPYLSDLLLTPNSSFTFSHNALASPQATLDDLQWILGTVWATGQHKIITVRQIGRGTGNDGTYQGPISNGAGKYLIELYNIESAMPDGVARKVLAGELDMGGVIENNVFNRDLLRFQRVFTDPSTYAELFIGKNFLNSDGGGMLDKTYKIATPLQEWAEETIIYRPEIDVRIRPQPNFW